MSNTLRRMDNDELRNELDRRTETDRRRGNNDRTTRQQRVLDEMNRRGRN